MDVLGQGPEVGHHFRLARAVAIGKEADNFESARPEFEIAPDREIGEARGELASDDHLGRAVRRPAPSLQAHAAVNLVRDGIDAAHHRE